MKTRITFAIILLIVSSSIFSCKDEGNKIDETTTEQSQLENPEMETEVMTKELQEQLTPQIVLDQFKAGNARFVAQESTSRNHGEQVRKTAVGQFPKAIVLSCVDSRVPVEDLFDQGIGDIFVGRVAGNFVNTDLLGSMEFATAAAGAKLVVILGHKACGAVKGAIDNVELGNITAMLTNIKPAVTAITEPTEMESRTSKNEDFVEAVSNKNVQLNIQKTLDQSPLLKEMKEKGQIKIIGATYDLETGIVSFFE